MQPSQLKVGEKLKIGKSGVSKQATNRSSKKRGSRDESPPCVRGNGVCSWKFHSSCYRQRALHVIVFGWFMYDKPEVSLCPLLLNTLCFFGFGWNLEPHSAFFRRHCGSIPYPLWLRRALCKIWSQYSTTLHTPLYCTSCPYDIQCVVCLVIYFCA